MAADRFNALDSLRGIAALVVVVNHSLNLFPAIGGPVQGLAAPAPGTVLEWLIASPLSLAWHGKGAVALFFVLSGFVLALPWRRGRAPAYGGFVVRRVCRIYLPYAAAVSLAMLLATLLAAHRPPPVSAWFDTYNWTEPVSWPAILDHLLMLGGHDTFDNAVWSLDHEMRISLVFPLLILTVMRFGLAGAAVLAIGLYGLAGAITHFAGWHGAPAEAAATLRFATFFVVGIVLARHADGLAASPSRWSGVAGLGALVCGLGLLWAVREPAGMAFGAGFVILAAVLPGAIRRGLGHPLLLALGRMSYSLYLIHLPVILSAMFLLDGHLPRPLIAGLAFIAAQPAAWLFMLWVEEPAHRLGRRLTRTETA